MKTVDSLPEPIRGAVDHATRRAPTNGRFNGTAANGISPQRSAPGDLERDFVMYVDSGDRVALGETLARVGPELRRIARYYVRQHDVTEDLVQATILTAIERAETFDRSRRLVPWLTGILLNKIAAQRRQTSRRFVDIPDEEPRLEHGGRSPYQRAQSNELERLVEEALEQLPPRYREVLEMYLREGKRGGEIAMELRRPAGTIRAQIHRGLRRLRRLLPPSLALGSLFALRRPTHAARTGATPSLAAVPPIALTLGTIAAVLVSILVVVGPWSAWFGGDESVRGATALLGVGDVTRSDDARLDPRPNAPTEGRRASARLESAAGTSAAPSAALRLRAVDRATGAPLAAARVQLTVDLSGGARAHHSGVADAQGYLSFDVDPRAVLRLNATASASEHADLFGEWEREMTPFEETDPLLLPLLATRPFGGFVVDTEGRPIDGASVFAAQPLLDNGSSFRMSEAEVETRTDADGRWSFESLGAGAAAMRIRASHPDYAPILTYDSAHSLEALWNLESRVVLHRGRPIEAIVRDERGAPLHGATLSLGEHFDPPRSETRFVTDRDGRALFTLPAAERLTIVAQADGYQRRIMRRIDASDMDPIGRTPLEFRLLPAASTSVLVVDGEGRPIPDGRVRLFRESWNEAHATDAQGRVEIPCEEPRRIAAEIRRTGAAGGVFCRIDLASARVQLPPLVSYSVRAIDATTGEPLVGATVHVVAGEHRRLATQRIGATGEVDIALHSPNASTRIEASCPGYERQSSPDLHPGARSHRTELRLRPTDEHVFDLRSPAGQPIDFFEVALATPDAPVTLARWSVLAGSDRDRSLQRNGGDGVRLNRVTGPHTLVALSRTGIAVVSDRELARIESDAGRDGEAPAVRLRERCCLDGNAAPFEVVRIDPRSLGSDSGVLLDFQATADAAGRFHFCGLPPAMVRVFTAAQPGRAISVDLSTERRASVAF